MSYRVGPSDRSCWRLKNGVLTFFRLHVHHEDATYMRCTVGPSCPSDVNSHIFIYSSIMFCVTDQLNLRSTSSGYEYLWRCERVTVLCGFPPDLASRYIKDQNKSKEIFWKLFNFSSAFWLQCLWLKEVLIPSSGDFFISLSPSLSSIPFFPLSLSLRRVKVQICNSVGVTAGRFVLLNDNEVRHEVKLLNTER